MQTVTNISTYKFAPLSNLKELRSSLLEKCKQSHLKGTILLSTEGINLFVAGKREQIEALVSSLRKVKGLEDLTPKVSESNQQPFTRMLVKIKKEIIAFGVETVKPAERTSPKLSAKDLKQWLDEGRDVLLLDTRNDYEVKLGTFNKAVPIGIRHFRDFPKAVRALPTDLKEKPIVLFCTGGIRCEKAGPFMEQEGFKNIFQLDGGILKYFEECGGAHYQGGCFVFDQRVGVDPSLIETLDKQCFLCLSPLTPEDQKDPRYIPGKTCPYCFKTAEEKSARCIEAHTSAIRAVTTPLPGKTPYDNYRSLKVPKEFDGVPFLELVTKIFPQTPKNEWLEEFALERFLDNNKNKVGAYHTVRAGERYLHISPHTSEPDVNADIRILYEDEALLVIHKPAPLPVHPSGRFNRNTLQWILNTVFHPLIPRPAHRLDANTTGVILFAKSKHFAGLLQRQFAKNEVEKIYLAKVIGHPKEDRFQCNTPIVDKTIECGARTVGETGLDALTEFKVLERHPGGSSTLEVRPKTGRTNQIRTHLWSLGFSILGDSFYLPNSKIGERQTSALGDAPLHLHSFKIRFCHPASRKQVEFSAPPPDYF